MARKVETEVSGLLSIVCNVPQVFLDLCDQRMLSLTNVQQVTQSATDNINQNVSCTLWPLVSNHWLFFKSLSNDGVRGQKGPVTQDN